MRYLANEGSVDRLLKRLGTELMENFAPQALRSFGWYQYRDHDHAQTLVATELAADAFLYLSFDEKGSWRRNALVIKCIISFLRGYYKFNLTADNISELKSLIDAKPLNTESITGWFFKFFPPDPAPDED